MLQCDSSRERSTHPHPPDWAHTRLIEVGQGAGLAAAAKVRHVHQLEIEGEAGVGGAVLWRLLHVGQVAQGAVPPVVQLGQRGARAALQGRGARFRSGVVVCTTQSRCLVTHTHTPQKPPPLKHAQPLSTLPAHLCVELDVGRAQPDEAREERLVQAAVLLDGHVLDNGGQLVVVTNQDHTLQPVVPVLLALLV